MDSGHPAMDSHPFLRLLLLLPLLLLLASLPAVSSDLESDRAALLAFRAAVGRSGMSWNASASPCSWAGVMCKSGRVVLLRLPGSGLIGQIPAGSLGNLTALRILSLRLNALSGPLPADLSGARQLRSLYLQGNLFSGAIPDSLFELHRLVRLNLGSNNLTGGISPSFNNLTRLGTLFLESNSLSGQIPDLILPTLTQFNISFNRLSGSIPVSLQKMPSNAFLGMSLCGEPLVACTVPAPAPSEGPADQAGSRG